MAGGAGGQIGIVSFKNMPADFGVQNGTTATIIFTQNSTLPQSGVGNTQFPAGIGTFVTVKGFENGALVSGINTTALVAASKLVPHQLYFYQTYKVKERFCFVLYSL